MAAIKCPVHGSQIAGCFCEHVAAAVESNKPMQVFLQQDRWGWHTVCTDCALSQNANSEASTLVCEKCIVEWAKETESDYLDRCKNPVVEAPGTR